MTGWIYDSRDLRKMSVDLQTVRADCFELQRMPYWTNRFAGLGRSWGAYFGECYRTWDQASCRLFQVSMDGFPRTTLSYTK